MQRAKVEMEAVIEEIIVNGEIDRWTNFGTGLDVRVLGLPRG